MGVAGNNGGAGGAKNLANAAKKPKVTKKPAGPPVFAEKVPVRPGAPTPKGAGRASTQAERSHVHEARRQRAEDIAHAQAAHDILTQADKDTADKANAEREKHAGLHVTPSKRNAIDKIAAERAAGGSLGKLTGINFKKALDNAPGDALELAVTTPSSVAKLGSTAVTHPKKLPGMLAEPYKQLIKDPKGFIENKPVTTALMLQPAARAPGLAAGKVARVAGKQTLERPAATLAGTALKEPRRGSKDITLRSMQARKDAKNPQPEMTAKQVQRQVDETYAAGKTHAGRVEASAYREGRRRAKAQGLSRAERKTFVAEHVEGAKGGARNQADQRFAKQFGATAFHTEEGTFVKPKNATEGVLHDSREPAQKVADKLNTKAPTIAQGTRLYGKEQVPNEFVVKEYGGKFAAVPKVADQRLGKQKSVGTSKATVAKGLRQSRKLFTGAVLPYRPTWLSGQGIEGVVRSAVSGAGPTSYLRTHKVVKAMEAQKPGSGKALLERAAPGGLVGRTAAHEMTGKTLREEFPDSTVARALTDVGRAPGPKQVRQLHHAVSSFVFEKVNAKALEGVPQKALLGRALKDSPLMERHLIGLSDKAIQEAAEGLQGTHNQIAAARAVQRSYGNYASFSPKQREVIMHWTPFLPWYINTAQFLLSVLPKDHPVAAGLAADASAATEEWRKQQGLSTRGGEKLPAFMLGGYPTKGGKSIVRLGHYTPFGIGEDVTGAVAGLPLPQFKGAYDAVSHGLDWKGHELKHPDGTPYDQGEKWLYGLLQLGESFVPLASQTEAVIGAKNKPQALKKQFRVLSSTPSNRATSSGPGVVKRVEVKPVRVKPIKVTPVKVR